MKTNYFSHDSNARNDEKLIRLRMKHKAAGYGVYFMILEIMRDSKDFMCVKDYNVIAFDLRVDAALIKSVVEDFGLFEFTDDGKRFYSESFLSRMKEKDGIREKRVMAGKISAKRFAKQSEDKPEKEPDANPSPKVEPTQKQVEPKKWTTMDYCNQFAKLFNMALNENESSIKPVRKITSERTTAIMEIYRQFNNPEDIKRALVNASRSSYLNGRTKDRKKPADFDYIIRPEIFLRCLENSI